VTSAVVVGIAGGGARSFSGVPSLQNLHALRWWCVASLRAAAAASSVACF
jgi:hypothetical protein